MRQYGKRWRLCAWSLRCRALTWSPLMSLQSALRSGLLGTATATRKVFLEPSEGLSRRTSVSSRCRHANHRGLITLQAPERVVGHRQGRSAADASRVDPTAGHHHGSDRRRRHAAHGHPIRHTRRGAPDPATSLRTLTAWSHGERRLCACSSPVPARRPPLRRALGACISSACTSRCVSSTFLSIVSSSIAEGLAAGL